MCQCARGNAWRSRGPTHAQGAASPEEAAALAAGCRRLVDPGPAGMGATYRVMAIAHAGLGTPAALEPEQPGPGGEAAAAAAAQQQQQG